MISVEEQQRLLISIARRLKKPVTAYAIGGTAMMFHGFKDATLDIDIVFETEKDRDAFRMAAEDIGYQRMDPVIVYGAKQNRPVMLKLDDNRLDLFVKRVISFYFSEPMMERAAQTHQFGDNLYLKIADPHDIILMKCATEREKDADDARKIINNIEIDWDIIIQEAQTQIGLGRHLAAMCLGEFLEQLKEDMGVNIPQEVLDELFGILEKQARDKQ